MLAGAASAQSAFSIDPGVFANAMAVPPMVERLERSHRIVFGDRSALPNGAERPPARPPKTAAAAATTVVARDPQRSVIPVLAEAYPAASRPLAQRLFKELLGGYAQIEQQFGVPHGDVAGAVAAFLTGSYAAYRGTPVPDEHFRPLVAQMRTALAGNPRFLAASAAEKQQMYEHLAIVGMFMATTYLALQQQPNETTSARMREAAKTQLEGFLGTHADRLTLGPQGLAIR